MKKYIATGVAALAIAGLGSGIASATSVSRDNARESARSYLSFTAFSRSSLIDQLKFEGFSTADATYAIKAVHPNWYVQAVKSAKSYLKFTSFSRSSLIEQLEFEGFTPAQARYGVSRTGL